MATSGFSVGAGASGVNWADEYTKRLQQLAQTSAQNAAKPVTTMTPAQQQAIALANNSQPASILYNTLNQSGNLSGHSYTNLPSGVSIATGSVPAAQALADPRSNVNVGSINSASATQQLKTALASTPASSVPTGSSGGSVFGSSGVAKGNGLASIKSDPKWYGGLGQTTLTQYTDNPQQAAYEYAQQHGLSDYATQQLQNYIDPSFAYLIGLGNHSLGSTTDQLNYYGGLYDYAMNSAGQNANNQFNPAQIMSTLLNVKYDPSTDAASGPDKSGQSALGSLIYGSSANVSDQVDQFVKTATGSLRGIVPDIQLQAYQNLLYKEGQAFISWKNQAGNATRQGNFGQWLQDRLGATGGV